MYKHGSIPHCKFHETCSKTQNRLPGIYKQSLRINTKNAHAGIKEKGRNCKIRTVADKRTGGGLADSVKKRRQWLCRRMGRVHDGRPNNLGANSGKHSPTSCESALLASTFSLAVRQEGGACSTCSPGIMVDWPTRKNSQLDASTLHRGRQNSH